MEQPFACSMDDVLASHLDAAHRACVASAYIGIAGAGGLGSNCAMLLARSGVQHFVIADHDSVVPSNLNRQHYTVAHLGVPKVTALGDVLRTIVPAATLDLALHQCLLTPNNVATLFATCPLVVEAVDDAATKTWLVQTLLQAGKVVVSASGMAGWGGDMTRRRLAGGRLRLVGDFTRAIGPNCPPMAPRVMMAAAMQADEVLCWLFESLEATSLDSA